MHNFRHTEKWSDVSERLVTWLKHFQCLADSKIHYLPALIRLPHIPHDLPSFRKNYLTRCPKFRYSASLVPSIHSWLSMRVRLFLFASRRVGTCIVKNFTTRKRRNWSYSFNGFCSFPITSTHISHTPKQRSRRWILWFYQSRHFSQSARCCMQSNSFLC